MRNTRLNKLEKSALIILGIFVIGMIFGYISGRYRFHEFRAIYHFFWISNYILVFSSFVWGIVNTILISKENYNWKRKLLWIIIGLLPILYLIIMMTIAMFCETAD